MLDRFPAILTKQHKSARQRAPHCFLQINKPYATVPRPVNQTAWPHAALSFVPISTRLLNCREGSPQTILPVSSRLVRKSHCAQSIKYQFYRLCLTWPEVFHAIVAVGSTLLKIRIHASMNTLWRINNFQIWTFTQNPLPTLILSSVGTGKLSVITCLLPPSFYQYTAC